MKGLELYKWINDNNIEWHYEMNFEDNNGEEDVLIFPYTFQMEEFYKLLSPTIFDNNGIECTLMDGYFAIWMNEICEHYGIDLKEVFIKK